MEESKPTQTITLAAIGDIHVRETEQGKWEDFFRQVSRKADVLLICGDLTDTGHHAEAEVLARDLQACSIPVVAVLGNHDYERDQQKQIRKILEALHVHVLDGETVFIKGVGFAGTKGFGGGFDKHSLAMFGETAMKSFVQEAVDETLKLDRALSHLEKEHPQSPKVVVLHYSPTKATITGEPEQIYPFLGSSRLAEPINNRNVTAAFHGHAHIGTLEATTSKGVKVFNVSHAVLERSKYPLPFYLLEIPIAPGALAAA
ncbi:MAG: metallophosphoesterase [Verrucomicrobiota bacterium]|nr:metallophosphoesterase [Verrucomicrobiota bacterium]